MTDRDDKVPFIERWSRQKRRVSETPKESGQEAQGVVAPEVAPVDLSQLPDIDTLTAESDIAVFLRKGVPEAVQRLALRRMWALDPSIRDFVEVAENQWDFNAVGGVRGLFEEIPPGTDTSAWLAQATHSALPPLPTEPDPAVVEREAEGRRVASQQASGAANTDRVLRTGPVVAEPSDGPVVAAVSQPTNNTANLEVDMPSSTRQARRRHGGALPF